MTPASTASTTLLKQFGLTTVAEELVPRLTQAGHHEWIHCRCWSKCSICRSPCRDASRGLRRCCAGLELLDPQRHPTHRPVNDRSRTDAGLPS